MEKQLPAVVARLMRGELEAQHPSGCSDQTSLAQRRSKILQIDLYVLGSPSQKVGEGIQNEPHLADLVVLVMRLVKCWRRFSLNCQFVSTKTENSA